MTNGNIFPPESSQHSIKAVLLSCVLLGCATVIATFFFSVFVYPFYYSPLRNLPGPKDNFPFLGQCRKLIQAPWVPQLFQDWSQQWVGRPFIRYLGLANSEYLVVCSNTAYQEILKSRNFVKPAITRRYAKLIIGDGLPFAEGELHRVRRGSLMKAFNTSHVRELFPTIRIKAQQLVATLRETRGPSGKVEVESLLRKAVLDVIGIDILGSDLNHLGGSDSPLYGLFDSIMQQSTWGHVVQYLHSYLPLRKLLPTYKNSSFLSRCEEVRSILKVLLDVRRKSPASASREPRNVLEIMVGQGDGWKDDEIVEYLLNLFMLGHDTTACTVVWALHLLASHQKHQERLRIEMVEMLHSRHDFTFDDLERLPFLDGFLREVLRVYCPVTYVPREATKDVVIDGVQLPEGTVVNLCPHVLNLQQSLWGENATDFDPQRWAAAPPTTAGMPAVASFHHGPRACLGKKLAMAEIKVMLIELILDFSIRPTGEAEPLELAKPSFTLRPKHLLNVKLLDRRGT